MWRREKEPDKVDALITAFSFGECRDPLPIFDKVVQRVTLNDGLNRVRVIVYREAMDIEEIKRVARIIVDRLE
jgi:hypothetical protein